MLLFLPNDLLLYIASFLLYPQKVSLAKTCQRLYKILLPSSNLLWEISLFESVSRKIAFLRLGWFPVNEIGPWDCSWSRPYGQYHLTIKRGRDGLLFDLLRKREDIYIYITDRERKISFDNKLESSGIPVALYLTIGLLKSEPALIYRLVMDELLFVTQEKGNGFEHKNWLVSKYRLHAFLEKHFSKK